MRAFTTLRSQFVAVVATAVILSNLALVAILEVGGEGELRGARTAAAVDRVGAIFDYLSSLTQAERDSALQPLSGNVIRYSLSVGPPFAERKMTDEEGKIAADLVSSERNK